MSELVIIVGLYEDVPCCLVAGRVPWQKSEGPHVAAPVSSLIRGRNSSRGERERETAWTPYFSMTLANENAAGRKSTPISDLDGPESPRMPHVFWELQKAGDVSERRWSNQRASVTSTGVLTRSLLFPPILAGSPPIVRRRLRNSSEEFSIPENPIKSTV